VTDLGIIFVPDLPPEELHDVGIAADRAGLEQLWLWEDCFQESGIATAAAVLAWTERLTVGIGLLPVPLRNVALTAMELATLERLFPGRLRPGIGHGVLDWMGQTGTRVGSPMTLLREYADALRRLLHGETVTTTGRYVRLTDVTLAWPPTSPPPLLIGGIKPRTLQLAGELGDGTILTGDTSVAELAEAIGQIAAGQEISGRKGDHDVVVFVVVQGHPTAAQVAAQVNEYVAAGATTVALQPVGDGRPLAEFARFVATEVRPLVD
jgi:alkanesulfonate monooxygenase SsuD/methylene tetrahydromethanopterin reductase-like flavin-dependent oxidoreductase (luciferase family)